MKLPTTNLVTRKIKFQMLSQLCLGLVPQPLRIERRNVLTTASAGLLASGVAAAASAKSGQFGKLGLFGMSDVSSPYVPGGPQSGKDSTYGYAKSDGPILADGCVTCFHPQAASAPSS